MQEQSSIYVALRAFRKKIAHQNGWPAYCVFNDETLGQLATFLPITFQALRKIKGIGHARTQKYGQSILSIIENHREKCSSYDTPCSYEHSILVCLVKKTNGPHAGKFRIILHGPAVHNAGFTHHKTFYSISEDEGVLRAKQFIRKYSSKN